MLRLSTGLAAVALLAPVSASAQTRSVRCESTNMRNLPITMYNGEVLTGYSGSNYARLTVEGRCGSVVSSDDHGVVLHGVDNTLTFEEPLQRFFIGIGDNEDGDDLAIAQPATITNLCGDWYEVVLDEPATTATLQDLDPAGGAGYGFYVADCVYFPAQIGIAIDDGGDDRINIAEASAGITVRYTLPVGNLDDVQPGDTLDMVFDNNFEFEENQLVTAQDLTRGYIERPFPPDNLIDGTNAYAYGQLSRPRFRIGGLGNQDESLVDLTRPPAPTPVIDDGGDGVLNIAEVAQDVAVSIGLPSEAEAGDTLHVDVDNDGSEDQTTVLTEAHIAAGAVDITVPSAVLPADGPIYVAASLTDIAGNEGDSGVDEAPYDITAPLPPIVDIQDGGDGAIDNDEAAAGVLTDIELPEGTEAGDVLHVDTDTDGIDDHTLTLHANDITAGVVTLPIEAADVPTIGEVTATAYITDAAGNDGALAADTVDRLCVADIELCDGLDGDCDGTIDGTALTDTAPVSACLDTDNDGLTDHREFFGPEGTDFLNADTDGDGVQDGTELGLTEPELPGATDTSFIADADADSTTVPTDDDSDDDGLLDGSEDTNSDGAVSTGETDPNTIDSDGDRLSDGLESGLESGLDAPEGNDTDESVFVADGDPETTTNPVLADTDEGGARDDAEDTDLDGIYEPELGECDPNNPDDDGNCLDSDNDGLTDAFEDDQGTDPFDDDTDDDGLTDDVETSGDTSPTNPDTDSDGIQDGTESGLTEPQGEDTDEGFVPDSDPTTTTDPTNEDSDNDGLTDGEEDADVNGDVGEGETDPNDEDTDDGGVGDGVEVDRGTDPLDPADDVADTGLDDTDIAIDTDTARWLQGGCGCESAPSGAIWLALPMLALLGGRRRSR